MWHEENHSKDSNCDNLDAKISWYLNLEDKNGITYLCFFFPFLTIDLFSLYVLFSQ